MKITRIGHATMDTPDVGRALAYYTEVMGLSRVTSDSGRHFLTCPGDRHSLILQEGPAACAAVAFHVGADTDLDEAETVLRERGVTVERRSNAAPGTPDLLRVQAPDNIVIEVSPDPEAPSGIVAGKGIAPTRLGHIAFNVTDPVATTQFFVETFGFRVSDWMENFFSFMRCGPDHHTLNLKRSGTNRMHHIAFEARDWNHIKDACDLLSVHDCPLIWGPGRHGIGHNLYIYHLTPDGQVMELYAELDQMSDEGLGHFDPRPWHKDKPQRPKVWKRDVNASNQWGIPTPERMRD